MYRELVLNTGTLPDLNQIEFRLNQPLQCYAWRVVSISLLQNWDATSDGNNQIAFVESPSNSVLTATLPSGTYDSTSILDAIGTAMTSKGSQSYTATYDQVTRRLSITTSGGKDFKILGGARGSSSFLQLGIDKAAETGYGKTFILPNPLNLSASQPILVTSRTLLTGGAIMYPSGINSDVNVIASLIP